MGRSAARSSKAYRKDTKLNPGVAKYTLNVIPAVRKLVLTAYVGVLYGRLWTVKLESGLLGFVHFFTTRHITGVRVYLTNRTSRGGPSL